jgi:P-type Cu+ transporter
MKEILLHLEGMTCTSCANQIEKNLNQLAGTKAQVNYATATASIITEGNFEVDKFISIVENLGYHASLEAIDEDASLKTLARKRNVAVVIGSFALVVSMIPTFQFYGWQWVLLVLTLVVHLYSATDIHKSAFIAAKNRFANMDTLISLGTLVALAVSIYALFFTSMGQLGMKMAHSFFERSSTGGIYLEVAAVVPAFILMGRYFEAKSKHRNLDAISQLKKITKEEVEVIRENKKLHIIATDLTLTDLLVVKPGERIVADGLIVEGQADVDESIISGESLPLLKKVGSSVIAGSTPIDGELIIRPVSIGADSVIGQIEQLIIASQTEKSQTQYLVDRISGIFVPTILVLASLTFIFWIIVGAEASFALSCALAVLIIACPCALGLATPVAVLVSSAIANQNKILIRSAKALELSNKISTIFFDKTGTITTGALKVASFKPLIDQPKLINSVAFALAKRSTHPVSIAVGKYHEVDVQVRVENLKSIAGGGLEGEIDSRKYQLGNFKWLGIEVDDLPLDPTVRYVGLTRDGELITYWALSDSLRPTSKDSIENLKKLGLKVVMLTGDGDTNSQLIAEQVGIDNVYSELKPAEKVAVIEKYKENGEVVAFVGDGLNDAAALSAANLSIAMSSGSYVALAASDLTILRGELEQVVSALKLGRKTLSTIKINLFWAFAYNSAMIPIAMAGYLQPIWAGAAMALSSSFVVANSLLLKYRNFNFT